MGNASTAESPVSDRDIVMTRVLDAPRARGVIDEYRSCVAPLDRRHRH